MWQRQLNLAISVLVNIENYAIEKYLVRAKPNSWANALQTPIDA